jgi:hypothetical protein
MASDVQHDKVATVFASMDADGDGYLTEGDFRRRVTVTAVPVVPLLPEEGGGALPGRSPGT